MNPCFLLVVCGGDAGDNPTQCRFVPDVLKGQDAKQADKGSYNILWCMVWYGMCMLIYHDLSISIQHVDEMEKNMPWQSSQKNWANTHLVLKHLKRGQSPTKISIQPHPAKSINSQSKLRICWHRTSQRIAKWKSNLEPGVRKMSLITPFWWMAVQSADQLIYMSLIVQDWTTIRIDEDLGWHLSLLGVLITSMLPQESWKNPIQRSRRVE